MKKTVRVSTALLPAALRARFDQVFEVARTRTVVQWDVVDAAKADVIVCARVPDQVAHAVVICIGDGGSAESGLAASVVRLDASLRVAPLMTALELAAIRVLNVWDTKAKALHDVPPASRFRYRLKHWVPLDPDKSDMAYVRVLAAMTRRPVSRNWIATEGGLNGEQADRLLAELQLRGALLVVDRSTMTAPAAPPAAYARQIAQPATADFVSRLRRWLSGARSERVGSAS